jgi:hypothetical protein
MSVPKLPKVVQIAVDTRAREVAVVTLRKMGKNVQPRTQPAMNQADTIHTKLPPFFGLLGVSTEFELLS